jgi:hypothetical protein
MATDNYISLVAAMVEPAAKNKDRTFIESEWFETVISGCNLDAEAVREACREYMRRGEWIS